MKTLIILLSISLCLVAGHASAQPRKDSLVTAPVKTAKERQQLENKHYRRALGVDSAKAVQVAKIQSDYKAGMKTVLENQSLNQELRKERIRALMEEKNRKLSAILTPAQQARIIPGTEREEAGRKKKN